MKKLYWAGFTMIELLVVIAIIGILAAVVYASFGDARIEAKNRAMMSDLKQLQLAMELYRAQEDEYPQAASMSALGDILTPDFLPNMPAENKSANPDCELSYETGAGNSSYKVTAAHCYEGKLLEDAEFARCPSSCGSCDGAAYNEYVNTADFFESLSIYSRGGECY